MEIPCEQVGSVKVLTPSSRTLDAASAKAFGNEVTGVVAPGDRVVLDLNRVEYIDSSGCGALITIIRHLRTGGGDLKLAAVTTSVRVFFELTRVHRLVDIYNTRDEAIKAFQV